MQVQTNETLLRELHRVDSVNRARASLGYFINAAKDAAPGSKTYLYNLSMSGEIVAIRRYNESIVRLARVCRRAELNFSTVLLENNITLI